MLTASTILSLSRPRQAWATSGWIWQGEEKRISAIPSRSLGGVRFAPSSAAALDGAKHTPPRLRGKIALIRFSSPCQIHPLVAQAWRGRLRDRIVLAVNTGYRPGWVHFAVRSATGADLIRFLAEHRPPGAGPEYGSGHAQATGGALRPAAWADFAARIGFPEETVPDE